MSMPSIKMSKFTHMAYNLLSPLYAPRMSWFDLPAYCGSWDSNKRSNETQIIITISKR